LWWWRFLEIVSHHLEEEEEDHGLDRCNGVCAKASVLACGAGMEKKSKGWS